MSDLFQHDCVRQRPPGLHRRVSVDMVYLSTLDYSEPDCGAPSQVLVDPNDYDEETLTQPQCCLDAWKRRRLWLDDALTPVA